MLGVDAMLDLLLYILSIRLDNIIHVKFIYILRIMPL